MDKMNIYCSASQQPNNVYAGGDFTEEEVMHIYIKDHLVPKLEKTGRFNIKQSDPSKGLYDNIAEGNAHTGRNGMYVSHHSNAFKNTSDGLLILSSGSTKSLMMATILYEEMKGVGPDTDEGIRSQPNFAELKRTVAPAIIIELFYHDNMENMKFGITHLNKYAEAEARALVKVADEFLNLHGYK